MERLFASPRQSCARPVLQMCVQALLLLGARENSLCFAIFSAGDGSACRSRGGVIAALGRSGAASLRSDRLSESSHRCGARGISWQAAASNPARNNGWSESGAQLALTLSQSQVLRAHAQLQFVLSFIRAGGNVPLEAGRGHCDFAAVTGCALRLVDRK